MVDPGFLRHIKTLVVLAIFSDDQLLKSLVLKGGSLMDLVYQLNSRSSIDVDFSMDADLSIEELESRVRKSLDRMFEEHDFVVFDFTIESLPPEITEDMREFWGGYRVLFKIINRSKYAELNNDVEKLRRNAESISHTGSTKFKIEISRHEFCDEKTSYRLNDYSIYGYTPEMFIAEKLRAICQQMREYTELVRRSPRQRARDFLDIFVVSEKYGIDWSSKTFSNTIERVFAKKRVQLSLLNRLDEVREFHSADFVSVKNTVTPDFPLESFDFYFDYVCEHVALLQSFRNK